jgi:hypothetical protein
MVFGSDDGPPLNRIHYNRPAHSPGGCGRNHNTLNLFRQQLFGYCSLSITFRASMMKPASAMALRTSPDRKGRATAPESARAIQHLRNAPLLTLIGVDVSSIGTEQIVLGGHFMLFFIEASKSK